MKTIRVSDKGQIAIPQAIRELLDINKGDDLVMFQIDGKILLEKANKTEKEIKGEFKDVLHFSEQSLKEVWDNPEDEIWSQDLKNAN